MSQALEWFKRCLIWRDMMTGLTERIVFYHPSHYLKTLIHIAFSGEYNENIDTISCGVCVCLC